MHTAAGDLRAMGAREEGMVCVAPSWRNVARPSELAGVERRGERDMVCRPRTVMDEGLGRQGATGWGGMDGECSMYGWSRERKVDGGSDGD